MSLTSKTTPFLVGLWGSTPGTVGYELNALT